MSPGTFRKSLVAPLALALVLPVVARPALGPAELKAQLTPLYERLQTDPTYLALDAGLAGHLDDRAVVDRYLRYLPLSPLEILKIDMHLKRYELATPRILSAWHRRWVELHRAEAEAFYGAAQVEAILGGAPEGAAAAAAEAANATVGTNRNSAATFSPSPLDYQGEIQVKVNPADPNEIVSAANTWDDIGGTCGDLGLQAAFHSSDGGATWGYSCPPDDAAYGLNCGSFGGGTFGSDPAIAWDTSGNVFLEYMLLCFTSPNTYRYSVVVAKSTNGGASWSAQGVVKSSWNSPGTVEDKNFYAIDTHPGSPFFGRHYTCWDRNNDEKFAYSTNGGAAWTEVNLPNVSVDLGCDIAVQDNGTVHVVWDTLTCGVQTCSNERLFYSRSTNGGVSWSAATQVVDYNLTGFSNTNCPDAQNDRCIGPFGTIAVDNSGGACDGTLYVTYTDYTSSGVNNSDVWVRRSTDNGATWQAAVKVNDDGLTGRIQFHPYMEVDQGNGHLVVGWHDARNDPGNDAVDYYLARSTSCGVSFEANIQASQPSAEFNNSGITSSNENSADNPGYNPNQYGEYLGVDALGGKAYLAWTDTRHYFPNFTSNNQRENVGFAVVDFGGGGGPVCGNNLIESGEVCDGTDLGGETCVSQGFSGGTLACAGNCLAFDTSNCTTGGPTTVTFNSAAGQDGWLRESSENSNAGGTADSNDTNASALRAGDNKQDRQFKLVVSFDTSSIPDGATITSATLRIKRGSVKGTNPHTTHGSASADVHSSGFGGSTALAAADFQAAATATAVATMSNPASNGAFSEGALNGAGLGAISKTGTTQFRVQFSLDDNDDHGDDYLGYRSGEAAAADQPQLVVTYQ